MDDYVIEHSFPKEYILEYWKHARGFKVPHTAVTRYQTNMNSSWTAWPGSPHNVSNSSSKQVTSLGLSPGEHVTKMQFDFGTVPSGLDHHIQKAYVRLYFMGEVSTKNFDGQPNDIDGNPITIGTDIVGSAVLTTDDYSDKNRSVTIRIDPDLAEVQTYLSYVTGGPYNSRHTFAAHHSCTDSQSTLASPQRSDSQTLSNQSPTHPRSTTRDSATLRASAVSHLHAPPTLSLWQTPLCALSPHRSLGAPHQCQITTFFLTLTLLLRALEIEVSGAALEQGHRASGACAQEPEPKKNEKGLKPQNTA